MWRSIEFNITFPNKGEENSFVVSLDRSRPLKYIVSICDSSKRIVISYRSVNEVHLKEIIDALKASKAIYHKEYGMRIHFDARAMDKRIAIQCITHLANLGFSVVPESYEKNKTIEIIRERSLDYQKILLQIPLLEKYILQVLKAF